jgi:hypothetical protein
MSSVVKYADLVMLATERRDLDIDDGSLWPCLEGIPASDIIQIVPLRPGQAYGLFINRFNELTEHAHASHEDKRTGSRSSCCGGETATSRSFLMREVATRLDVTFAALTESMDQRMSLDAEINHLRQEAAQ